MTIVTFIGGSGAGCVDGRRSSSHPSPSWRQDGARTHGFGVIASPVRRRRSPLASAKTPAHPTEPRARECGYCSGLCRV